MLCEKCGTKMENDSVFCPTCGEKIIARESNIMTKEKNTSSVVRFAIIGMVISGLAGFVVLLSALSKSVSGENNGAHPVWMYRLYRNLMPVLPLCIILLIVFLVSGATLIWGIKKTK